MATLREITELHIRINLRSRWCSGILVVGEYVFGSVHLRDDSLCELR